MDKIEKIRDEIERRIEAIAKAPSDNGVMDSINGARGHELMRLLSFLDTLAEEPDESMEEAALSYVKNKYNFSSELVYNNIGTDDFKAGAEWQKSQMLKDAVEGEIQMRYSGCLCAKTIHAINEDKFNLGDKVRIIIVKEED